MPFLDRLAQRFGGGAFGVDQEQQRAAMARALQIAGLQTIGSAGTLGLEGIIPGIQSGLQTFDDELGGARGRLLEDQQTVRLDERQGQFRAQAEREQTRFDQEQNALSQDAEERREQAEFIVQNFENNRSSYETAKKELTESPFGGDLELLQYLALADQNYPDPYGGGDKVAYRDAMFKAIERFHELSNPEAEEERLFELSAGEALVTATGRVVARNRKDTATAASPEPRITLNEWLGRVQNSSQYQVPVKETINGQIVETDRTQFDSKKATEDYLANTQLSGPQAPDGSFSQARIIAMLASADISGPEVEVMIARAFIGKPFLTGEEAGALADEIEKQLEAQRQLQAQQQSQGQPQGIGSFLSQIPAQPQLRGN